MNEFINQANGILFSVYTVYALLATGLIFTIWTGFGQYRALTHGVQVIRGKYDSHNDPGAINHFQALSAALSATVGLGNIAGVGLAVALGGPGAVFWMWVIGVVGMSLKMTEVSQSMLFRNTDDPDNPHGGPMFVCREGFKRMGLAPLGVLIGGIFVVTLLISAITGGNMFQAWNVAEVTHQYFEVPQIVTGVVLTVVVGAVILGGIKRIGSVAGRLVPFMCAIYVLAAAYVLVRHIGDIPGMLTEIVTLGLGLEKEASASGAFIGGAWGFAAMWGIKRALFSSEAGQGSAPIAHAAAKTDEPVREGVVAGLEPFIDTIVVCTMTALVIMASGAYNRAAEALFEGADDVRIVQMVDDKGTPQADQWTIEYDTLPSITADSRRIHAVEEGHSGWDDIKKVFMIVETDKEQSHESNMLARITGSVDMDDDGKQIIKWGSVESGVAPTFRTHEDGTVDRGIYGDYPGASLTAHAFDRVTPGLGMWLVTLAAWLFAISTMISWSYYGEQGIVYLFGDKAVFGYKIVYCLLILLTCVLAAPIFTIGGTEKAIIGTDAELDMWTTLGLGVMLVVNIPIMLIFAPQTMKAYHNYMGKLKRKEFPVHEAQSFTDVIEGRDDD